MMIRKIECLLHLRFNVLALCERKFCCSYFVFVCGDCIFSGDVLQIQSKETDAVVAGDLAVCDFRSSFFNPLYPTYYF